VGFSSTLASYILPTAISAFHKSHPDVNFDLYQGSYHHLIESVKKGDTNLALLGPIPAERDKLMAKILFTEKIVSLFPVNHPLDKEKRLSIEQFSSDAIILFPD